MFRLDEGLKVYLHRAPVDFRLSVNGLATLVQEVLGLDPFAACIYVFRNRMGHEASIANLNSLGVTAMSLLPVKERINEERLVRIGLTNCRGYNTIGFFTVEPRPGATPDDGRALRREIRYMVKARHAVGIEAVLDVGFNHTAESDETGPSVAGNG